MPMTREAEKAYKPRRKPEAPKEPMNPQTRALLDEQMQEQQDERDRQRIKGMGYAKGGVTRADGCVTKGHTKGKMIKMSHGGKTC
jgi:hypothetical protein